MHVLSPREDGQFEWIKAEPSGTAPRPRGDHTASLVALPHSPESQFLLITGGRDHTCFFKDMHVLDVGQMAWCTIPNNASPTAPQTMCNHMALGIQSVPNYKLFIFGGQAGGASRTDWKYMNAVDCMDLGRMEWMASDSSGANFVQGGFPTAREDCAYAYDRKNNRVLLHGGWADKWFRELYYLDVSSIVGPPYACYSLVPSEGPMTGQTPMTLIGQDFSNASSIKIHFSDGKNTEVVDGKYVSPTQLTCNSPDWTKYAAGEVSIRVNLKGDGWSVNIVKWNFFVNTKPAKCVAYGPGLFDSDNAGWGFPAVFKVQAKDTGGRNRTSGGEAGNWKPKVVLKETGEAVACRVEDCGDGTYDFIYVPHRPGSYVVEVGYCDPLLNGSDVVPIRGSPWTASFDDPWSKARPTGEAPVAAAGATVCSVMKKMVLYGGGDDVVCFDPDSMAWDKLEIEGNPPARRTKHTMTALDGEKALVCGGWSDERGTCLNDVVLLVCDKTKWRWQEAGEVQGDKFGARCKHAACLNVGKRVVVFGGVGVDEAKQDDAMVLSAANPAKMEWLAIAKRVAPDTDPEPEEAPPPAPAEPDPPAAAAAAAEHAEGEDEEEEGHKGDGEAEAEAVRVIPVLKEVPGRRCDHGLAAVEGVVYAFGGQADVEKESVLTAVTVVGEFELEGKTLSRGDGIRWRRLKVSGDVPCARMDFVMTSIDGKVVVQVSCLSIDGFWVDRFRALQRTMQKDGEPCIFDGQAMDSETRDTSPIVRDIRWSG